MKKILLFAVLLISTLAIAQTGHFVTLSWIAPSDATAAGTMTVFRGIGDCSTNPTMNSVGSVAATVVTYNDPIGPGTYCYYLTHTENKTDSVPSNTAGAVLRPNAASGLTVTVK